MASIAVTQRRSLGSSIEPSQPEARRLTRFLVLAGIGRLSPVLLALAGLFVVAGPLAAQDLSRYRDIPLGATLAEVMSATRSEPTAVSDLHARPRLMQELLWRPRYTPGGSASNEAVREVTFSFLDDQLFRIVVRYDPYEIEGLTAADLIEALSTSYGAPMGKRADALATWERDGVSATLSKEAYPSPYHLTVLSTRLAGTARTATAEAERLDRVEGPARRAAMEAEATRERAREEAATRSKNKAVFRP